MTSSDLSFIEYQEKSLRKMFGNGRARYVMNLWLFEQWNVVVYLWITQFDIINALFLYLEHSKIWQYCSPLWCRQNSDR